MKYITAVLFATLLMACASHAQNNIIKLWTTDSTLAVPESVLFDAQNNVLYASLINGRPDSADGNGGIAKIGLDGKIINANWVTGLDAPKGMGKFGNTLYAADLTQVDVIDISTGKLTRRIPVAGSVFLNDITIDGKGVVYVSDTRTGKVHRIENDNVSTWLEDLKTPNGVLAVDNDLYVLTGGSLNKADANKKLTLLAEGMDESTDGIEQVAPGEFLISCWNGIVYYVKADGSKQTLFDTRSEKINSADIGYDPNKKIFYVPTFFRKSVVAYQLK